MTRPPDHPNPTAYGKTVALLLGTARRRALGRQKRQQELMRRRTKKPSMSLGGLASFGALAITVVIHCVAAYICYRAVTAGQVLAAEQGGKIVVDGWFKAQVNTSLAAANEFSDTRTFADDALDHFRAPPRNLNAFSLNGQTATTPTPAARKPRPTVDEMLAPSYGNEAREIATRDGSTASTIEDRLRAAVGTHGSHDLITRAEVATGLTALSGSHSLTAMLGSIALLWWAVMLVFQGEGLELDLQRRRHPMWEWLYSHPVSTSAIFTAEILSPIVANPIYWSAPVFVGVMYGLAYDPATGILAALAAGIPLTVAAACLGKALEIGSIIRFSPRSRGALLGFMSWIGYASMMLILLGATTASTVATAAGRLLAPLTVLPWPWLGWFIGRQADGTLSLLAGLLACWAAAGVTAALAIRFCVWGASQGLSGNFAGTDAPRTSRFVGRAQFGRDPLYRKEFLWFARDRSAIVQTILIPLTIAGFQVFNLRHAIQYAQGSWNYLSGAAILFGTYFLWILGPKSLASEGSALWLALTWPRGLESLLKAKAWLWSLISTGIVILILGYTVFMFPAEAWKVVLVGVGWLVFARSMAEKTVTLVTVSSSSGDPEPIPRGRRWAASLGMLTFAIGVLTQQWNLAVVGVVYSYLTAAAMWENFRARLPFLYDPWSETLPPPPTLMHAMVAISVLVEGGAVLSVPVILLAGRENFAVARSVAYTLCALVVSVGVSNFLRAREVRPADIWCWRGTRALAGQTKRWWCGDGSRRGPFTLALLMGVVGGLTLGLLAHGYIALLLHFPSFAETIREGRRQMDGVPGLKISYAFCAVAVAPFAEEYLFRGLLFRALDREWGGWRAVMGSAAFFAIYHPPLAWLPVGLLGVANAALFKNTGRLTPAVVLHMVYNAVVLAW